MVAIEDALVLGCDSANLSLGSGSPGFSFSAGATDLLFSASLPAAAKTWLIIPLGIMSFVLFYAVFRFMIVKMNLKTPGREDAEVTWPKDEAAYGAGADGKYVPAEGKIAADLLQIRAEAVPLPVSVRYAWTDWSDQANLCGENGLPLEPFCL